MDKQILREIGLTEGEINVYLALLKLGEAKKTALAKESGVSSSKVYEICDRLAKKGIVGHIMKNDVKHFQAMEPKHLIDFFDEKAAKIAKQKAELEKVIPFLEKYQKKENTKAALFEGITNIKNLYKKILEDLGKGDSYNVIGVNYGDNSISLKAFFENYHKQRAKKGISVKMLVNHEAKEQLVSTIHKKSTIKYLPQQFINNTMILFYKNTSIIFFLVEDPIALVIHNKEMTKGFQAYFDMFWGMGVE